MAIIHLNRAGQNLGQFSEQAVSDGLKAGTFLPSDLAWSEGKQDWQPLSTFTTLPPPANPPPANPLPNPESRPTPNAPRPEIQSPGKIHFGECWNKAWECFLQNWGPAMVGTLIFFAISILVQAPIQIAQPLVQGFFTQGTLPPLWVIVAGGFTLLIFWIISLGISAILPAGFFYFFIETLRTGKAKLGNIFIGFREGNWIQLLLAMLVWIGTILVLSTVLVGPGTLLSIMMKSKVPIIVAGLILLIPMIYFSVMIGFVFPLIVDRKIRFWEAIMTSLQTVHPQWFQTFGLMILMALVMLVGVLACCVGLIASMPLAYLLYSQGYRQLFGDRES